MKDQFAVRSSGGNLPEVPREIEKSSEDTLELDATNTENNIDTSNFNDDSVDVERERSAPVVPRVRKRSRQDDRIGEALVELEREKLKILESRTRDENLSFFESLLPHIKKLTSQKKMLLRMKMQEMVYNFVYGNASQESFQEAQFSRFQSEVHNIHDYSTSTSAASYISGFTDNLE